ncbi:MULTISPECIES: hypothetical protein [Nostoc]|uniref:Uncharacterized protein n=2 Tax=Nostoc TaxID=1177 RepID=A0ABR8I4R5_9NOSO|nr:MULTISPECIES: hypothetical protein [Nostoc]MBD2561459.1 hypothetical protein [Nostoc linckia FACHB-391]MBD2646597.1 hypothetical protein [Nostoc foliaceum FACHB-393]
MTTWLQLLWRVVKVVWIIATSNLLVGVTYFTLHRVTRLTFEVYALK